MTEKRDPKISAAYRTLGDEEPPPALDVAITAAARRAVVARPGRSGVRCWAPPLAAAAVLVLAVGVALQLEREQPLVEPPPPMAPGVSSAPVAKPQASEAKPSSPVAREAPAAQPQTPAVQDVAPAPALKNIEPVPPAENRKEPVLAAPAPAPQAPAAAASGAAPDRADRRALSMERSAPATRDAAETPEQWLERIAAMRRDGRNDEADRALAQFRSRYPDYRMSDELRRRVEPADR